MTVQTKKLVADGAGTALSDLAFPSGFPATVVVTLTGGTAEVEYSCDKEKDLQFDPVNGRTWIAWDFGTVTAGTPGVNSLVAPVTALRVRPSGGVAELNIVAQPPL